ncbi:hypothetical protein D3C83_139240 [compost metagenome]
MGEEPEFLKLLHDSADRRGRQADGAGNRLGPDRLPAVEVCLDHQPENVAHARGQVANRLSHAGGFRANPFESQRRAV